LGLSSSYQGFRTASFGWSKDPKEEIRSLHYITLLPVAFELVFRKFWLVKRPKRRNSILTLHYPSPCCFWISFKAKYSSRKV